MAKPEKKRIKNKKKKDKRKQRELKDTQLEILLQEYELTCSVIEKFVSNQFLFTQGGLVIAGGYTYFLIEQTAGKAVQGESIGFDETKFYLQFLPIVILMIFMALAYQLQRTMGMQGYKKFLAEKINEIAGKRIVSYVFIGNHFLIGLRSLVAVLNGGLYFLMYAAAVALAFVKPDETELDHPYFWLSLHIGLGALYFIFAFRSINTFSSKVYDAAHEIYNDESKSMEDIVDHIYKTRHIFKTLPLVNLFYKKK